MKAEDRAISVLVECVEEGAGDGAIGVSAAKTVRDGTRGTKTLEGGQLEDGQVGEHVRALAFVEVEEAGEDGAAGVVFPVGEGVALAGGLGALGGADEGRVVGEMGDDIVKVAVGLIEGSAKGGEVKPSLLGEGSEEGSVVLGFEPLRAAI